METFGDLETGTLGDLFAERIRNFQSSNRISAVKRYTTILKHLKERTDSTKHTVRTKHI